MFENFRLIESLQTEIHGNTTIHGKEMKCLKILKITDWEGRLQQSSKIEVADKTFTNKY